MRVKRRYILATILSPAATPLAMLLFRIAEGMISDTARKIDAKVFGEFIILIAVNYPYILIVFTVSLFILKRIFMVNIRNFVLLSASIGFIIGYPIAYLLAGGTDGGGWLQIFAISLVSSVNAALCAATFGAISGMGAKRAFAKGASTEN